VKTVANVPLAVQAILGFNALTWKVLYFGIVESKVPPVSMCCSAVCAMHCLRGRGAKCILSVISEKQMVVEDFEPAAGFFSRRSGPMTVAGVEHPCACVHNHLERLRPIPPKIACGLCLSSFCVPLCTGTTCLPAVTLSDLCFSAARSQEGKMMCL